MSLPDNIRRVIESVRGAVGIAPATERQAEMDFAAGAGGATRAEVQLPDALRGYVEKVTHDPYKVVERDLDELVEAGYTEDAVFEITVATALGAAVGRMEKTLTLIEEDQP